MRINREERRGKIQNERLFKEKNLDLVQDRVLSLPYTCITVFSVWYRAILACNSEV